VLLGETLPRFAGVDRQLLVGRLLAHRLAKPGPRNVRAVAAGIPIDLDKTLGQRLVHIASLLARKNVLLHGLGLFDQRSDRLLRVWQAASGNFLLLALGPGEVRFK
jgi:hypothetical protein